MSTFEPLLRNKDDEMRSIRLSSKGLEIFFFLFNVLFDASHRKDFYIHVCNPLRISNFGRVREIMGFRIFLYFRA
jgi:hypothetical protein